MSDITLERIAEMEELLEEIEQFPAPLALDYIGQVIVPDLAQVVALAREALERRKAQWSLSATKDGPGSFVASFNDPNYEVFVIPPGMHYARRLAPPGSPQDAQESPKS